MDLPSVGPCAAMTAKQSSVGIGEGFPWPSRPRELWDTALSAGWGAPGKSATETFMF